MDLSGLEFIDAAGVAAQERAVRHQEVVTGQLQVALNSRVIIGQARGVLAGRLRVTPDEAFVILRRYARDRSRRRKSSSLRPRHKASVTVPAQVRGCASARGAR